jgi:hypothetical protein
LIRGELRGGCFLEAHRFGGDDVHERPTLDAGKDGAIQILRVTFTAENHTCAWTTERLVGRAGDEVRVSYRARMNAAGDEACDVRHVDHHRRADARCDLGDARKVDHARIGTGTDHDHLRLVLFR